MEGPEELRAPPGADVARLVPQAVRREHALRPRSSAASSRATSRDGRRRRRLDRRRGRADRAARRTGPTTDYADRPSARPVLAAVQRGVRPGRAVGREDGGGVPGRPARMRPVPQAPVRPLDPGRLPRLRQRLRRRAVRRSRPRAWPPTAELLEERRERGPGRRAAADPPAARGLRRGASTAAAGRPRRPAARSRPRRSAARSCADAGDPREALFDWMREPDNPFFARSFVNRVWAPTSASASSTRWTTSRWPTRRRTRGCSTPWRRTSSSTASTSASWSGRSSTRGPTSSRRCRTTTNLDDRTNFARADAAAADGRGRGRRARTRRSASTRTSAPTRRRAAGRSRSRRAGSRRRTSPASSGSSAARRGPRLRLRAGGRAGPAADAVPHDRPAAREAPGRPAAGRSSPRTGATRRWSRSCSWPRCRGPRTRTRPGRPSTTAARGPTARRA